MLTLTIMILTQTSAPYLPLSWCWVWAQAARCSLPLPSADFGSSRFCVWSAWIAEVAPGSSWVLSCTLTDRWVQIHASAMTLRCSWGPKSSGMWHDLCL
jgi:hypothetical protein